MKFSFRTEGMEKSAPRSININAPVFIWLVFMALKIRINPSNKVISGL
jgi:hypothetical protein